MVAGIGGFGGQFPLDTSRYEHPVLVASTDGVGTKLDVARATGRYETVGIDLVAMCVDDLVCVGAEPLFLLDYIVTGRVDPDRMATVVVGHPRGLPPGRVRPDRGRDGRAPRGDGVRRPRPGGLRRGGRRGRDPARPRAGARRRRGGGPGFPGLAVQRLHARPPRAARAGGAVPRRPGVGGRGAHGGRRAAAALGRLHARRAGGAPPARCRAARVRPCDRAGASWATCPGRCRRGSARSSTGRAGPNPACSRRSSAWARSRRTEMDRVFNRGVGMALVVDPAAVGRGARGAGLGRAAVDGHRVGGGRRTGRALP